MKRLIITLVIISIIYYFYNKDVSIKNSYKNLIKPKISSEFKKDENNELTNIIYKIQTYYYYNPQTFEEIIKHLETFIILYKSVKLDNNIAGQYYDLMDDKRELILNNLRSFFINLPVYKDQFNCNQALDDLEKILNKYLDEVNLINKQNNYKEIHRDSKFIDRKNLAHNRFTDNIASFSYY
jgi:hypothetical protein